MAAHGSIGSFDADKELWTSYTERLQQFFIAHDVKADDDAKKKTYLVTMCGYKTYQLIRSLAAPATPESKTYAELVKLVKDHQEPPPSTIMQRFAFHTRIRREGESFADFVAHLRKLSEHCEFGDKLSEMLRDRLVCGCNDDRIQRQLLAKPSSLTFDEALSLAQACESSEKNARRIQSTATGSGSVNALRKQSHTQPGPCYRCGGKHSPSACRFKDAECHFCKKPGHIAKVCRSKRQQSGGRKTHKPSSRPTNFVATPDNTPAQETEIEEDYTPCSM